MRNETTVAVLGNVKASSKTHPLFASRPAAGFPSPGDDLVEKSLDVHDYLVKHPASTFFVRVEGDSMVGAGIFSGDVLAVDRSLLPKDGSIVVAAVYGELVVKRLQKKGETHFLVSENEAYPPITVSENDDCYIWGVVTGSVRKFI